MINKIIVLAGSSSQGKTSTLNIVYDDLIKSGATIITSKVQLGNASQNDFSCTLQWKHKTIAFYTMGDYWDKLVNDAINLNNALGVDVLIIAFSIHISWSKYVYLELSKYYSILIPKVTTINPALETSINKTDAITVISNI